MQARGMPSSRHTGHNRGPKAMENVHANQEGLVELNRLGRRLKTSPEVLEKAADTLKRAYTGIKCFEKTSKECIPAGCLSIAAKMCKKSLDRESLLKQSNIGHRDFGRTLGILCGILSITREVSINELCAEFSCNAIKASARQMLEVFKRKFWASLIEERREHADFSRPVFAVVAVILTAERHKAVVKVPDRKEMMQATGVKEDDYKYVREQMSKFCTPSALEAGSALAAPVPTTPGPAPAPAAIPEVGCAASPIPQRAQEPLATPPTVVSRPASVAAQESPMCEVTASPKKQPPAPPPAVAGAQHRRGALPRPRTVLQAHTAPPLRPPTGFNTVCSDGLPSTSGKHKRKLSAEQEEAAKKQRTEEYQRWKASVLATRERPEAPIPPRSEAESVVGVNGIGACNDGDGDAQPAAEQPAADLSPTGSVPPDAQCEAAIPPADGAGADSLRQVLAAAAERRIAAASGDARAD